MSKAKFSNTSNKFDNTVAMSRKIQIYARTQATAYWYLSELYFKFTKIQNQFVKKQAVRHAVVAINFHPQANVRCYFMFYCALRVYQLWLLHVSIGDH